MYARGRMTYSFCSFKEVNDSLKQTEIGEIKFILSNKQICTNVHVITMSTFFRNKNAWYYAKTYVQFNTYQGNVLSLNKVTIFIALSNVKTVLKCLIIYKYINYRLTYKLTIFAGMKLCTIIHVSVHMLCTRMEFWIPPKIA